MLQNPCKTFGFKKNMVYKIPLLGGEVNHIQPVAYTGPLKKLFHYAIFQKFFHIFIMNLWSMFYNMYY